MREKEIEHNLVMETRKAGGMAVKFVSPSFSGMPDRLVLLGDGKIGFVEVKAPGQKPRPLLVLLKKLRKPLSRLKPTEMLLAALLKPKLALFEK